MFLNRKYVQHAASFFTFVFLIFWANPLFAQDLTQRMGLVRQTIIVGGGNGANRTSNRFENSAPLAAYCLDEARSAPSRNMRVLSGAGVGYVRRVNDGVPYGPPPYNRAGD